MAYNYQQMPNYYGQQQPMFPNGNASPDMLNQYKGQYQQPMQPQPMPQQMMPAPIPSNDMIWVLNESEATSYPVAPNTTVTLWDKNEPTIYIKSVNAQGIPSMRILDFAERTQNTSETRREHVCNCGKDFVRIDDFKTLEQKYIDLESRLEALSSKPATKSKKATESEEK